MITDTPRTDAASFSSRDPLELLQTSQQLERELAASQAEVERLKKELDAWDYGTRAKREQEARKKAEAEVERLKEAMISCLHITNCYDGNYARACDNVDLIVRNALK
jgi:exonuclease VII large subunit